jgi:hypothetical protein
MLLALAVEEASAPTPLPAGAPALSGPLAVVEEEAAKPCPTCRVCRAWRSTTLTMKSQGALSPAGKLRLATKTAMVAGMTTLATAAHTAELLLQVATLPGRWTGAPGAPAPVTLLLQPTAFPWSRVQLPPALQPVQALSAIWAMTTAVIVAMTSSPWMRALRKGWKRPEPGPEVWAGKELGRIGHMIY